MKKKPSSTVRVKLWIRTSLVVLFVCILLVTCRSRHDRLGFQETQAIKALQVVYTAELRYQTIYPAIGFSCSLQALGGDLEQGPATATSAQLLIDLLPYESKSGYTFNLTNCTKSRVNGVDEITGYAVTAVPQKMGRTRERGFCLDQLGELKIDPAGGTNCTEHLH
jgi:type IV pilus assembly protein PilA